MKTAVSVPDGIFERADQLAKRLGLSRSKLYSIALQEYLARQEPDQVTAAMNSVVAEVGAAPDIFAEQAARSAFEKVEW